MQILKKLINTVPNHRVDEISIGVFSTLVKAAKYKGVASTLKGDRPHGRIRKSGSLEKLTLRQLSQYALSDNVLEASLGMAAINSTWAIENKNYKQINAKKIILEHGRGKNVGVIGHFPFLEKMKEHFNSLYIFEKRPRENDYREEDIPKYLPDMQVIALTATSLTNHTFENIMESASDDSFIIMLGPSTPLSPILFDYGLDVISGTFINDYPLFKKYVTQATPTRHLKGKKYVSLFREDYK
ncbi:MAG TPA: DUF364 domain-containing protein [bacterium]|nr:DUF364 domain-containing protein [bacterium]